RISIAGGKVETSWTEQSNLAQGLFAFRTTTARAKDCLVACFGGDRLVTCRRDRRRDPDSRRTGSRTVPSACLQHFAGRRLPLVQDRLRGLPIMWPDAV